MAVSKALWVQRNVFDPKTIKKSVTITKLDRLKLCFRRTRWSVDSDDELVSVTRYKVIKGVAYILDVRHHPKESQ